jgi:hypothetical protein
MTQLSATGATIPASLMDAHADGMTLSSRPLRASGGSNDTPSRRPRPFTRCRDQPFNPDVDGRNCDGRHDACQDLDRVIWAYAL